jgi:hypothetical protein
MRYIQFELVRQYVLRFRWLVVKSPFVGYEPAIRSRSERSQSVLVSLCAHCHMLT